MRNEEHRIQVAFVNWFRAKYPKLFPLLRAIPNGGNRDAVTGAMLKAEGVQRGTADIMFLLPCGGYASLQIEMKTKTGRQSKEQKEYQAAVEKVGHKYVICRSLDDCIKEVEGYLYVKR